MPESYEPEMHDVAILRFATARTLLTLIRGHKQNCPGESCTITLSLLIPTYRALVNGRDLTSDELGAFL